MESDEFCPATYDDICIPHEYKENKGGLKMITLKEKAEKFLPLVQAMTEGKTIQRKTSHGWEEVKYIVFSCTDEYEYRILPDFFYVVDSEGFKNQVVNKDYYDRNTEACTLKFVGLKEDCEKYCEEHKPHFVPFENLDELFEAWQKKVEERNAEDLLAVQNLTMPVIWLKYNNHMVHVITDYDFNSEKPVRIYFTWRTFENLFEEYTFLDGTPCGKEIIE